MKEERITNDEVRSEFNNIPPVEDFIGRYTLRLLGKIVRTDDRQTQKKMLNAWIPTSRKSGAPQKTLRHRFKTTIKIALSEIKISKDAPLKEWTSIARNEEKWETVVDSFFENARRMRENEISDSDENTVR